MKKQVQDESSKSMDTVNKLVDEKKQLEFEKSEQKDKINNLSSVNTDLNDQVADLKDIKENLEIELELKGNQVKETDEELLELIKEKEDFKDKYIDMLNRTEGNERQIEELYRYVIEYLLVFIVKILN
jgi:chromosome segregation ATPase